MVRRRKIKNCFAQYAAHSRGFGLFGNGIFKVVHVCEGGHSSADLFRRGQPRAPANKFFRHIFGFRREDVFPQPLVERHVVTQPAKQGHRHMRVPVDETRENEFPAGIDALRGHILRLHVRRDPTATIASPFTATAPSSMMRRSAFIVTTVPPATSMSTFSFFAFCA